VKGAVFLRKTSLGGRAVGYIYSDSAINLELIPIDSDLYLVSGFGITRETPLAQTPPVK
jgi:hypothetical protein